MASSSDHVPQFEHLFDDAAFDSGQVFVAGVAVYHVFKSQSISPMVTTAQCDEIIETVDIDLSERRLFGRLEFADGLFDSAGVDGSV